MHWVSDPEERKRIIEQMRKKPWDGTLNPAMVSLMHAKFGFRNDFDLLGNLNEAIWRYKYKARQETKPAPFTASEITSGEIQSMSTAAALGLWKANNQHPYSKKPTMAARIAAAARSERLKRCAPGRSTDLPMQSLLRHIGCIFELGTGKKPRIARSKNRVFRGTAYRFAVNVFEAAGIKISEQHIRLVEDWRVRRNSMNKSSDSTSPLNGLIVSMSGKR